MAVDRASILELATSRIGSGSELLPRQQQLSHFLQSVLEAARDHGENTGQLDLHHYCGVEHLDNTGDRLTQGRDAENEPVTVPALAVPELVVPEVPEVIVVGAALLAGSGGVSVLPPAIADLRTLEVQ